MTATAFSKIVVDQTFLNQNPYRPKEFGEAKMEPITG